MTDTTTDTARIYVACLASYNAGTLHGEWIDATDADTIREANTMTTGITFAAIYRSKYGDTVSAMDPKREAYKQAAYILNVLGRRYSLTAHEDEAYTVTGDGLASLTFAPDTFALAE